MLQLYILALTIYGPQPNFRLHDSMEWIAASSKDRLVRACHTVSDQTIASVVIYQPVTTDAAVLAECFSHFHTLPISTRLHSLLLCC